MKYTLIPLDRDLDPVEFDTNNILHLASLGKYYPDDEVLYFRGDAYSILEQPSRPTPLTYIRELEAEAAAVKAERDRLLNIIGSAIMNNNGAIMPEIGEAYFLIHSSDWEAMGTALVAAA